MPALPRLAALALCSLLAPLWGCAGDDGGGGGTSGGGTTSGGGSGSSGGVPAYSHATDIQPVWTAQCVSGCHDSACAAPGACDAQTQNLNLALDGDAYDNLVGQMSVQNPSMVWVRAGDPGASYLWHKLAGTHNDVCAGDCGVQMPNNADPLDAATLQMISDWIEGGAKP